MLDRQGIAHWAKLLSLRQRSKGKLKGRLIKVYADLGACILQTVYGSVSLCGINRDEIFLVIDEYSGKYGEAWFVVVVGSSLTLVLVNDNFLQL